MRPCPRMLANSPAGDPRHPFMTTHYDAFNGDADGICSLVQLRLDQPIESVLVTGAKRDIALLQRVDARAGDTVCALDISVDTNRDALLRLLANGATVRYFDHHYAGELPLHPQLEAHIDVSSGVCTGIIVDRYLGGRQRAWAVVAAFGDNLPAAAAGLAAPLNLPADDVGSLQALGDALTYNAYGDAVGDMIVHPATLYASLVRAVDPLRFVREDP